MSGLQITVVTLLVLSLIANVVFIYLLIRFVKRLMQFDDLYQYLIDDIEINLNQFSRIRSSSLLCDDDEVRSAHKNMVVMSMRLDEFTSRMEEVTGQKLRKTTTPMSTINVTKEAEKIPNG
jgi:hypothetical protein